MEMSPGWCKWYVSEDFIDSALTQLTEAGVANDTIKIVNAFGYKDYYLLIYYNEPK